MVHLNKILNSGLFGMDEKIEDSTVKEIILDEMFIKVNRYKREMVNEEYQSNHEWLNSRYEIGVSHFGGYSEYARIPAKWIVPLPKGLTLKEAMVIGTAGFTAALSVQRLEENRVSPEKQEVTLQQLPDVLPILLKGQARGRTLVKL